MRKIETVTMFNTIASAMNVGNANISVDLVLGNRQGVKIHGLWTYAELFKSTGNIPLIFQGSDQYFRDVAGAVDIIKTAGFWGTIQVKPEPGTNTFISSKAYFDILTNGYAIQHPLNSQIVYPEPIDLALIADRIFFDSYVYWNPNDTDGGNLTGAIFIGVTISYENV